VFEFDPAKSEANAAKHGIDFEQAQALWDDPNSIALGTVYHGDEERHILVGSLEGRHWTAICTRRDGRIRIISVRRSRPREREVYDSGGV
jgi:uncharacterized DUF497 family protein